MDVVLGFFFRNVRSSVCSAKTTCFFVAIGGAGQEQLTGDDDG